MRPLMVPTVPNSPLRSPGSDQRLGEIALRKNPQLDFIENGAFDPALLEYDDDYQNSQAFSPRFRDHMQQVVDLLKKRFPAGSNVVEVGCGKGDFLNLLEANGFHVAGYDATFEGEDPRIRKRYLTGDDRLNADLVVLRHVLEHMPKPHAFLNMLAGIFGSTPIYVEVPSMDWIIAHETFFDITYEHVNYFTEAALGKLFADPGIEHGLIFDGQYQYVVADLGRLSTQFPVDYASANWEPLAFGALFPHFEQKLAAVERTLGSGREAYVWGAATKGCMFLIHYANRKPGGARIAFAVDLNPNKWDKFLPGSLVPIVSKEHFFKFASRTGLLIVSNPNYYREIVAEISNSSLRDMEIICL